MQQQVDWKEPLAAVLVEIYSRLSWVDSVIFARKEKQEHSQTYSTCPELSASRNVNHEIRDCVLNEDHALRKAIYIIEMGVAKVTFPECAVLHQQSETLSSL